MRTRLHRHRVKAARDALPGRPFTALAEDRESECIRCAAVRRGLLVVTKGLLPVAVIIDRLN
jgi:hypothetical protein